MISSGVVLDSCVPYTSGKAGIDGACPASCTASGHSYKKYHATGTVHSFTSITAIQNEIQTNGPIEVAFSVYQDFMSYKSGVYQHTSGGYAGGHAVKMIGWGSESGLNYWLCANSWNTSWGEAGYFKIAFGQCGIEGQGTSAMPGAALDYF